ncbi:hypothetical protein RN001_007093 [Aquatica leii]|uniref:Soluble interferon alpha/beta receptor OPG204 n=1 Tax=Aquatica leii TaxID=1421715 RepID=A0AAN7PXT0_9COLE|nr:hypothetical protein RN001_007093 [Aquatica leii]
MATYLLLITVLFNCAIVFGIEDYCLTNLFNTDGNSMEFTKEPSRAEFAITGSFKGLHCCAKGYRSIEWYKDGKPHPWYAAGVSKLIIYPKSANQTIYTRSVTMDDAGNYTCLLRNASVVYAHTITLTVYKRLPDDPKVTYISDNTQVQVGQSIRLFCEAFVGLVDLPDAYSEAVWIKYGENETFDKDPRINRIKVSRENDQTVGAYLTIQDLKKEDYGRYVCIIKKPGSSIELHTHLYEITDTLYINPNPVPYKKLLIGVGIGILLLLTALILNLQYGLFLRVQFKDRFGRLPDKDDKINDVLVLYSEKDSELALGVLLPTLEAKYNYKCGSRQLPQNLSVWYKDISEAFCKSRRIVAVISPSSVSDDWQCSVLYQALKQLYQLDSQFCCVTLKPFPTNGEQEKNSQGESFSSLVRNINVIYWQRSKDESFWLSLRLKLPPKRFSETNLIVNSTRLNSNALDMSV